jgi:general secretion pathway protein M
VLENLKRMPLVQKLTAQYDQLSSRDQKALQVLALAFAVTFAYLGVWRPIAEFRADSQAEMEASRELLEWVRSKEATARAVASMGNESGQTGNLGDDDLLKTVTDSADKSGMPLQRFEPSGNQAMRIWLEQVPFTDLTQWLAHLETKYGIVVDQASLDRADEPGLVDARITLEI